MPTNEEIRRHLSESVEAIRNDKTLSGVGKRRQIKTAYESAKAQLDENIRASKQERQEKRDTAYKALFSVPAAEQLSLRDALDRAKALPRGAASLEKAMRAAHDRGDRTMVKALALRAAEQAEAAPLPRVAEPFDVLLDEFAQNSGNTEALATLRELASGGPMAAVQASMNRYLPRPTELDQRFDGDDAA
jgi:hypothetical protein